MKVLVSIDANNIWKKIDGTYWSNSIHNYEFLSRYLGVFDEIVCVTRVHSEYLSNTINMMQVNGENVTIRDLPMIYGMKQYILNYYKLKLAVKKAVSDVDCAIFRLPSVVGFELMNEFTKTGKPFVIEVVADPYDAYKSNYLARFIYTRKLKKATKIAMGVSYVTAHALQEKYPPMARKNSSSHRYFESNYSSINLNDNFFGEARLCYKKDSYSIIHTSNAINNNMKGHRELLLALKIVKSKGYDVSITFVGDGRARNKFEQFAIELGLKENVTFLGRIASAQKMKEVLISGDMFVLPTKAEGLPRSIIEAMAVGLPCIATPVGGTSELLPYEYLVEPEDVEEFAILIIKFIENPELMTKASHENIVKAREYRNEILFEKRNDFYKNLKDAIK